MKIRQVIKVLTRNVQTRQQLRHLPEHLFEDIGKTQHNVAEEIAKNAFISIIFQHLSHFIKGA